MICLLRLYFDIILDIMQNKEENRGKTLCDLVNFNIPTEDKKSTIHNSGSRVKSNMSLKCSVRDGKKKTTIKITQIRA